MGYTQNRMKWIYALIAALFLSHAPGLSAQTVRGGFLESAGKAIARPNLTPSTISTFMPSRGAFRFPAPYNTDAVRLTNSSDCAGQDCVNYTGYSYWRNMNNHVGKESMLIFLGLDHKRGGKGPTLFEYNKVSGALTNLGPLFTPQHRLSGASGEGWYFSATMPTKLYINDGPRILRFDVITEQMQTAVDVTSRFGSGVMLTQMHTSDNDLVHSATVRNSATYRVMGCMAYEETTKRYHFFPITVEFDECQLDRSGKWLVVKANLDAKDGEDNLIVNLTTGQQRILYDSAGAGGHSDMGHGYMVAADNWAPESNTWKIWDLNAATLTGKRVYSNKDWNAFAPAHLSHTNARAGVAPAQQYGCGSSVNRRTGIHANEIICFRLDGTGTTLVVAPTMANLDAPGGGDEYSRYSKGNLDVTGRYFLWTSNLGGARQDVFIVKVPDQLLTGVTGGSTGSGTYTPPASVPPVVPPVTPPQQVPTAPSSAVWYANRNVTVASNRITKTSGCEGCADAGSISRPAASTAQAQMNFTVRSSGGLMAAGFSLAQRIPTVEDLTMGLRFQSGLAEVRERGAYRADIRYVSGDNFSITVKSGRVQYARNGTVFYSAPYTATSKLYAGTVFYNMNAAMDVTLAID